MSRFNLIDEKWIPVRFPDGTRQELGISEVLLRSQEIAEIEDPSPLVVAALHRFLLALLYRALEGPTDIDQAKVLFNEGLPGNRITAYLEKWRDRFWLFDEKYPFAQNPNVSEDEIEPWTKLTAEYNSTSNKVLFDHTNTQIPGAREPAACARWLVSTMTFSISGGRGYYPSPSPNAMICVPLGRSLHESLCFCLVPYPNSEVMRGDSALWERNPKALPLGGGRLMASGYADLYTWQSRMVFLEELPPGNVAFVRFIAGLAFQSSSSSPDPMQPHEISKAKGKLPVQFREDRGTWRDFDSLLPDNARLAPLTIQHALRLAGGKGGKMPEAVLVLGLKYKPPNANVDFWRMERFVLPGALAGDKVSRSSIRDLLDVAEDAGLSLRSSIWNYQRNALIRCDRETRKEERKFLRKMVDAAAPLSQYWHTLESHFHDILHAIAAEHDSDDVRRLWLQSVRDALSGAWRGYANSVFVGDAWVIRALVKAEGPVLRKLKTLSDEIAKLAPQKEVA